LLPESGSEASMFSDDGNLEMDTNIEPDSKD